MRKDDQRRIPRVSVCCRVDVRDQFGMWTAVTDDVSARGCRIATARLPRVGSAIELTISSDLFPESLAVTGEIAWVSDDHVGVSFLEAAAARSRRRRLSPAEWVDSVIEHGRVSGPTLESAAPRVAPVVRRSASARDRRRAPASHAGGAGEGDAVVLPIRKA